MSDFDFAPGPAAIQKRAQAKEREADALAARADTGEVKLSEARTSEFERRKTERTSEAEKQSKAFTELEKATTQRPHVDMPSADLGPPLDPKATSTLAWGIMGMVLIGAAGGRKHWDMAAAGLDGMLKGFKEGSEKQIAESKARFDREFKLAKEKQAEAIQMYEDTLKSKELTLNQIAAEMKVHAAANSDWDMQHAAQMRDFDKMYSRVAQMRTAADRLESQAVQLQDRVSARQQHREDLAAAHEEKLHPTLSEDTLRLKAEQYLSGDPSVKQNIGRGIQGSANLAAMENAISALAKERGMSGKDIAAAMAEFQGLKAGERTLGTRTANIEMAGTEADSLADLALKASGEWKRTGIKTLNDLEKFAQSKTASPTLRRLVAANTSFINAYARAINPQGVGTVADKEHAREMLEVGFANEDYAAAIDQLKSEIGVAKKAPGSVKRSMREGFTGGSSGGDIDSLIDKYAPR